MDEDVLVRSMDVRWWRVAVSGVASAALALGVLTPVQAAEPEAPLTVEVQPSDFEPEVPRALDSTPAPPIIPTEPEGFFDVAEESSSEEGLSEILCLSVGVTSAAWGRGGRKITHGERASAFSAGESCDG
jgi:hypothetical protein